MTGSRQDTQHAIVQLLNAQRICNVATSANDRPLNSAVEYVNAGTTLYFVSFPNTQKLRNLAVNPRVAVTISAPGLRPESLRGVQFFGRARVVPPGEQESIRALFFDRNLLEPATHWSLQDVVLVEVQPERIDLIDYRQGIGHKETITFAGSTPLRGSTPGLSAQGHSQL